MRARGRIRRRVVSVVLIAAAFGVGVFWGATRSATAAQQRTRVFSGGTGMVFNYVQAGQTTVFENTMKRVGEALRRSESVDRRRQGAAWKLYKATEPLDSGAVLYISVVDPVVSGADYWVPQILNEAFPTEVQRLYETYTGAFADGQVLVNLIPIFGS